MHAAIQLAIYWAAAFLTLGAAVILLSIFSSLAGYDLELLTLGAEIAIAAIASLVEAAALWLIVLFVPLAFRAMIIPALMVAIIYKCAHLEDWTRYNVAMLFVFQIVLSGIGAALMLAHFEMAAGILVGFIAVLALVVSLIRSM